MLEEALLREQFEALLEQERQAAKAYESLLPAISDPVLREQVEQLFHDKQRHIELAERLMEIVE